jgi:hypothetical protein
LLAAGALVVVGGASLGEVHVQFGFDRRSAMFGGPVAPPGQPGLVTRPRPVSPPTGEVRVKNLGSPEVST